MGKGGYIPDVKHNLCSKPWDVKNYERNDKVKAVYAQAGRIKVLDIDQMEVEPGFVRIRTRYSAISPGTELSMMRKSGNLQVSLGYSASGTVEKVGDGVTRFQAGQTVACYGAPYVKHAEYLSVPHNLIVTVPATVSLVEASTAGLGAIAVHALRQADLRFGESVLIIGLGVLGNLMAQMASAASYEVLAHDIDRNRCTVMRESGISNAFDNLDDLERHVEQQFEKVDCVILCAGGQNGNLIDRALQMLRDRGKVVIVADLEMNFSRELMFQKEAQILISRAGGPGRYDRNYEKNGVDYPIGYVRWTEGRNMQQYIRFLEENKVNVRPLISETVPIQRAQDAYNLLQNSEARLFSIVFQYDGQ
jgi:NADPH2:quinone reductase